MNEVTYLAPIKVEEAVKVLAEYGAKATILSGGTDIVGKINYYEVKPDVLVFIGSLGWDYIKEEKEKVVIGATATMTKLAHSALVAEKASALAEAASLAGCNATRNTGTIGGNLANASPAADLATPLLVMDAEVLLKSASGERIVAVKDFFTGPGETVCKPEELIVEIHIPPFKGKTTFLKLGRRHAMTLSVVNAAVRLDIAGTKCNEARIALGSVAPTPIRCTKAEAMIKGKEIDKELITKCAAEAIAESKPIDDQRATAWYRKKAGTALVARALAKLSGVSVEA